MSQEGTLLVSFDANNNTGPQNLGAVRRSLTFHPSLVACNRVELFCDLFEPLTTVFICDSS